MITTLLIYVLMVLIGGTVLWIISKLFSGNSPSIISCYIGASIAEFVSLFDIPFVPFIVLFIVLIKIGDFEIMPAFFGTIIYGIMKLFLFAMIVAIFLEIFG